ncbi:phosphate-starvation-inducible PsiE family protein [Limnoraphis robusta]|uniref:Phosphate-starvation-inducible PsiE family protein n=1 Tax=Limnoraphis robusta CCNP1315 TaxID=3110306 RepID=A0ABU5TY68_9CYAN|nr:phosphate-starvation-inducible PsiE family protein [Limnoraphis robusta]MEA5519730.1 phosphate-starvation-inducible PsiE family protein [Limnoraphis robusta CCNP1315]MEA5544300.1 phosphate-starvation-inducible PsiE family protein [Limnoraphis robusta CCNP1324]
MGRFKKRFQLFRLWSDDEKFIELLEHIEVIISKILSLAMVALIISATGHLLVFLFKELLFDPNLIFKNTLFEIFGLFLNLLIALELLENISAYLRKHVIQIELVIVTSLIAVARKIILFNLDKNSGVDLMGLALALFALAISYWIIRRTNADRDDYH